MIPDSRLIGRIMSYGHKRFGFIHSDSLLYTEGHAHFNNPPNEATQVEIGKPIPIIFGEKTLKLHPAIKQPQPGLQVSFDLTVEIDEDGIVQYRASDVREDLFLIPNLIVPQVPERNGKRCNYCFLQKEGSLDKDDAVHIFTEDMAIAGPFKVGFYTIASGGIMPQYAFAFPQPGTLVNAYCIQKFDSNGKLAKPHALFIELQEN